MSIDIVGTVHKKSGKILTDKDGFEYPERVAVWGYHANAIDEFIESADEYIMSEATVRTSV